MLATTEGSGGRHEGCLFSALGHTALRALLSLGVFGTGSPRTWWFEPKHPAGGKPWKLWKELCYPCRGFYVPSLTSPLPRYSQGD